MGESEGGESRSGLAAKWLLLAFVRQGTHSRNDHSKTDIFNPVLHRAPDITFRAELGRFWPPKGTQSWNDNSKTDIFNPVLYRALGKACLTNDHSKTDIVNPVLHRTAEMTNLAECCRF